MVTTYSETIKSNFKGTIIDIETIEEFCRQYQDSRYYQKLIPLIFGYIDEKGLKIHCSKIGCSKLIEPTKNFKETVAQILPNLKKPLYAFNCVFEQGVLYHTWEIAINFDGELNKETYESKRNAVATLDIENYDDPFNDIGIKCKEALEKGETELPIRHNRSCLLKERDILLRRGYRDPDDLLLYELDSTA